MTKYESVAPAAGCAGKILIHLASSGQPIPPGRLAEEIGATKSLVRRVLRELTDLDLVYRRVDGSYWLGLTALEVGSAFISHTTFRESAESISRTLASKTSGTIAIGVLRGSDVLILFREQTKLAPALREGMRIPSHCSAMGKILLAQYDEQTIKSVLRPPLVPMTSRSTSSVESLLRELEGVRESGVATESEEIVPGFCSLAVYIEVEWDTFRGAALSVSLDRDSYEHYGVERLATLLSDSKQALEKEWQARRMMVGSLERHSLTL